MHPRLTAVLNHPLLWQAGMARATREAIATGFPALDERLPGNGWPTQGLVEVLSATPGRSEWMLFAPALASWLEATQGWMALIAPPFEPYAPAFASAGLSPERILVIRTSRVAWAMEQTVRSAGFRCVLAWPQRMQHKSLRRLQLAAAQTGTLLVLNRQERCRANVSPAVLRVQLDVTSRGFELEIFKSRGGKAGRVCLARA
jgi:protein ImuA